MDLKHVSHVSQILTVLVALCPLSTVPQSCTRTAILISGLNSFLISKYVLKKQAQENKRTRK